MKRGLKKLLMASLFFALLMGCATDAPRIPGYFATVYQSQDLGYSRVALVTDLTSPEIESVDLGLTRGEGAVGGAAGGAAAGAGVSLDMLAGCSGSFCGAILILLLPVFVLGGAVAGAVSGTLVGQPADLLAEAEENARRILNSGCLQTELIEMAKGYGSVNTDLEFIRIPDVVAQTVDNKPDYKTLSNRSIDVVLEVKLLRISLEHSLYIEARARLVSVATGAVLSDSRYNFRSEQRELDEWLADGAAPLTEAIHRGLQTLAEDIVDESFLLFYPNEPEITYPEQTGTKGEQSRTTLRKHISHYVLAPVYPALEFCFLCGESPFHVRPHRAIANLEFVKVNSVQPTLQWERFPREYDMIDAHGKRHQVTDVRYDLRVFNTARPSSTNFILVPGQLVYDVRDIQQPYHKVNAGLNSCTDYFWTVRARFRLDGKIRVTEWAGAFNVLGAREKPWNLRRGLLAYKQPPEWLSIGLTGIPDSPGWFYYPFMTSCDSGETAKSAPPLPSDNDF